LNTVNTSLKPTVFLYEEDDARAFLKDRPSVGKIVTLTPNARAVLLAAGIEATPSSHVFTDRHHRQITARIRRADRQLCAMFKKPEIQLGEAAKETLRHDMCMVAMTALRLWMTLGANGPYLIPGPEGWSTFENRIEAYKAFRSHLISEPYEYRDMIKPPQFPGLVRVLNRGIARMLQGRNFVLVTAYQYGLRSLAGILDKNKFAPLQLKASRNTKGDFLHPLRAFFRAIIGLPEQTLIAAVSTSPTSNVVASKALDGVADPVIRLWLDLVGDRLSAEAGYTDSVVKEFKELIERLNPQGLIGHTFRWSDEAALAEAAGAKGVPRMLISHGSHDVQTEPFAAEVTGKHARGLLFSPLSDTALAQSPHAEKLLQKQTIKPDIIRSKPVLWGYKSLPSIKHENRPRRILHAGTYKSLFYGARPMMYETSDEYIDGLAALIRAVDGMNNTELVIRVRPAPECSIPTLHALLPKSENCRIKTDGSFLDDLATSDMLVSFSSTTIEEAIYANRPVLQWGGSTRYHHIEPSTTLPTPSNRAAIYAVNQPSQLGAMIEAVLSAHVDGELTEHEKQDHCWGDNMPAHEAVLDWLKSDLLNSHVNHSN